MLCAAQALSAPQQVVIDMDFAGMMSPSEVKSLLQQLSYSYSAAVSGKQQLHLHLLSFDLDSPSLLLASLPALMPPLRLRVRER